MYLVQDDTYREKWEIVLIQFAKWINNSSKRILVITSLLGILGAYFTVQFYANMNPDIYELLPQQARSLTDLKEISERLVSMDNMGILILSSETEASKRFVIDLVEQLQIKMKEDPTQLIAGIEYRQDPGLQFLADRKTLYVELNDLEKISYHINSRIEKSDSDQKPLSLFSAGSGFKENVKLLPILAIKKKYEKKIESVNRFPDGFFATPDEKKRIVLVRMAGQVLDLQKALQLKTMVEDAVNRVNPAQYAKDMTVHYTGSVQNSIEEQVALREDLFTSSIVVTVLVGLAMLFYFQSILATVALVLSTFIGTFWTFGLSYFLVGSLNANSAFLGSIIIGNGINCGIILLSRYIEERRKGFKHDHALIVSISKTAPATTVAAAAASLSYGSLVFTQFRGFNQFGVIGFIGMFFCWIASYTVLPALLNLINQIELDIVKSPFRSSFSLGIFFRKLISRYYKSIIVTSFLFIILGVFQVSKLNNSMLETDLGNLRSKKSVEQGSVYYSYFMSEIFGKYMSPIALLPHSRESAYKIQSLLEKQKGKGSIIDAVKSLKDVVPEDQDKKIAILNDLKKKMTPSRLSRMNTTEREFVEKFLFNVKLEKFNEEDIPKTLLAPFTEKNGQVGNLVLVEPELSSARHDSQQIINSVNNMRIAADSIEKNVPMAGSFPVISDLMSIVIQDAPWITLLAFAFVFSLVLILFRDFKILSLTLFSLVTGVIWFLGFVVLFKWKVNFLNFLAFPITFGVGVDYGINIFQRYIQDEKKDILDVVENTTGAILLCCFTTVVGYFSLIIAQNQGFISFGRYAILGELTCLLAAVVALPSFLMYLNKKKLSKKS